MELYDAMAKLSTASKASGFDEQLLELVNILASQINGWSFCLSLHIPLG